MAIFSISCDFSTIAIPTIHVAMNCPYRYAIALLCLTASLLQAQPGNAVTVVPGGYDQGIRNPMKGFTDNGNNHPWASTKHAYIRWNELENDVSDGMERIYAVTNQKFSGVAAQNKKVIPRVYLQYFANDKYWPADMTPDDYTSQQFQDRVVRLIERLGVAWDNDPRMAFVEMGIVGLWGEQHSPAPTPEIQKVIGDAFAAAFKNKKVSVRQNWHDFQETAYPFAEYWDSWAHYDQMWNNGKNIANLNDSESRYLNTYIGGEVAYGWGNSDTQPGPSPTASVSDPTHRNFVINSVRWLHGTQFRWISGYDRDDPVAVAGAEEIQKTLGYRYLLDEARISVDDTTGALTVAFDVTNEGSAPFYYDWPVEVALLDPNSLEPVWTSVMASVDIRDWHPGSGWTEPDWTHVGGWRGKIPDVNWNASGVTGWTTPPQKYTEQETFTVDAPAGNYVLSLAVLDPAGNRPSLRFATSNYINGGRHPIAQVNTETKVAAALAGDFAFDDIATDNSLSYRENPDSNTVYYGAFVDTQNGTVTSNTGSFFVAAGTEIVLTATADPGLEFIGWSGDVSGTSNPLTVTLDQNKDIRPVFVRVGIPGLIEAEGFRNQSGIQSENSSEGGQNIGYIQNGDWSEYIVNVPAASEYLLSLRVASGNVNGGAILVQSDNGDESSGRVDIGSATVPFTKVGDNSGWQDWQTINTIVNFTVSGRQMVRLNYSGGGGFLFNLNWMNFSTFSSPTLIEDQRVHVHQADGASTKHLALTFLRPTGTRPVNGGFTAAGKSFTVEASQDLVTWEETIESADVPSGLPSPATGYEWATFRLTQAMDGPDAPKKAFIRVKVADVAEP